MSLQPCWVFECNRFLAQVVLIDKQPGFIFLVVVEKAKLQIKVIDDIRACFEPFSNTPELPSKLTAQSHLRLLINASISRSSVGSSTKLWEGGVISGNN